jgi:hypothetical protein
MKKVIINNVEIEEYLITETIAGLLAIIRSYVKNEDLNKPIILNDYRKGLLMLDYLNGYISKKELTK